MTEVLEWFVVRWSLVQGNYVKDMTRLGRNIENVIIVDNSPASYLFQPENAIPCESFIENPADRELMEMIPFLESIASVPVRLHPVGLADAGGVGVVWVFFVGVAVCHVSAALRLCRPSRCCLFVVCVVAVQDVRHVLHQWCSPGPGTILGPGPVSPPGDGSDSKSDPN